MPITPDTPNKRPTAGASPPPSQLNDDTRDNSIYERVDAILAPSGREFRFRAFDAYRMHVVQPRPITLLLTRRMSKILTSTPAEFHPYTALVTIALEHGYRLQEERGALRESLLSLGAAPADHIDRAAIVLPAGARYGARQLIGATADPSAATAAAICNMFTGVILQPLLAAALPGLAKRVMDATADAPVTIDIERLHERMFLRDISGGHEQRVVAALQGVSARVIDGRPFQSHVRPLVRCVEHICRLQAKRGVQE